MLAKENSMGDEARAPLCPYGRELDLLMRERGIRSTAELSRFLVARGVTPGTAQQTLSYHMHGRTQPKPALVDRILDELRATEEQRVRIREAFWSTDWGGGYAEPRFPYSGADAQEENGSPGSGGS